MPGQETFVYTKVHPAMVRMIFEAIISFVLKLRMAVGFS